MPSRYDYRPVPSPPQQQVPIVVDVEQAAFFHRAVGEPVAVRLTPPIQP